MLINTIASIKYSFTNHQHPIDNRSPKARSYSSSDYCPSLKQDGFFEVLRHAFGNLFISHYTSQQQLEILIIKKTVLTQLKNPTDTTVKVTIGGMVSTNIDITLEENDRCTVSINHQTFTLESMSRQALLEWAATPAAVLLSDATYQSDEISALFSGNDLSHSHFDTLDLEGLPFLLKKNQHGRKGHIMPAAPHRVKKAPEPIIIKDAHLESAIFSKTTLSYIKFESSNMKGTTFDKCNFSQAVDLSGNTIDLTHTHINHCNWSSINLKNTNCSHAKFSGTSLINANLDKTNFSSATFTDLDISRVPFQESTCLEGASITLELPIWIELSPNTLKEKIIQLFTAINRISDKYITLKLDLIKQILASLEKVSVSFIAPLLWETLISYMKKTSSTYKPWLVNIEDNKQAIKAAQQLIINAKNRLTVETDDTQRKALENSIANHRKDIERNEKKVASLADLEKNDPILSGRSAIFDFIRSKNLAASIISSGNCNHLPPQSVESIDTLISLIEKKTSAERQIFMFNYNGFFVQLIYQSFKLDTSDPIRKKAHQLYAEYLASLALKKHQALLKETYALEDEDICHPSKNILPPLLFIYKDASQEDYDGLILSHQDMTAFLENKDTIDFASFIVIKEGESAKPNERHFDKIFEALTVFQSAYQTLCLKKLLTSLLGLLNLDDTYRQYFLDATRVSASNQKLDSPEHQLTLSGCFKSFYQPNSAAIHSLFKGSAQNHVVTFSKNHIDAICQALNISHKDKRHKAQVFLSLSAIFMKYSSATIFGTEYSSPEAIRKYACALMVYAYECDSSVFGKDEMSQTTLFKNYLTQLVIGKGLDGCTNILSSKIRTHITTYKEQPELATIFSQIKPAAWVF